MQFLDVPVSGGDIGAQNATLSIMCGGNHEVFQRISLLQILGKEIAWFGPAGSGQQAKMSNQILIASTMIGVVATLAVCRTGKT